VWGFEVFVARLLNRSVRPNVGGPFHSIRNLKGSEPGGKINYIEL
jgi:hypothetical protein